MFWDYWLSDCYSVQEREASMPICACVASHTLAAVTLCGVTLCGVTFCDVFFTLPLNALVVPTSKNL